MDEHVIPAVLQTWGIATPDGRHFPGPGCPCGPQAYTVYPVEAGAQVRPPFTRWVHHPMPSPQVTTSSPTP